MTNATAPAGRKVRLSKRIERALREGHPWVWRNALGDPAGAAGDLVTVVEQNGTFVGRGIADGGPIGVRLWTTEEEVSVGPELMTARFEAAAALRDRVVPPETNAYRLLHGEGDRVPGVVCDVYGEHAVLRLDGDGIGAWRDRIATALEPVLRARGVTNLHSRSGRKGPIDTQTLFGTTPTAPIEVREHGMKLHADLLRGQKTGLFLDQRESRRRVRAIAKGLRVLNLYGYTGGFSVAAALGGAEVVHTVDVSADAVEMASRNIFLNGIDAARHKGFAEDVPAFLEAAKSRGERYGLVISDPPNFAPNEDSVPNALESYRKLHRACLELLEPGGLYLAASCSSHIRLTDFELTIAEGARNAPAQLQHLERWAAPADHPRLIAFPEGDYLKAALVRRL